MAQSPDGMYLYVAARSVNNYSVYGHLYTIRMDTNAVIHTLALNQLGMQGNFSDIETSFDGSHAFISDLSSKGLHIIDLVNYSHRFLNLGRIPSMVADPNGPYAYIATEQSQTVSNGILVVNLIDGTVETVIPLESAPYGMALTPDGAYLYVTIPALHRVEVINTATRVVGEPIAVDEPYPPYPIILIPPSNAHPTADAGENVTITSQEQCTTTLLGTATDPDGDPLTYQWLEGSTVLESGDVTAGEAPLVLCGDASFGIGQHTLTLTVSDGQDETSDTMILTIDNSAPTAAPTGGGTYDLGDLITLSGDVADYDGDLLIYDWSEESSYILCDGTIQAVVGGNPVPLPACDVSSSALGLGTHQVTLTVSDGVNDAVSSSVEVTVKDDTKPTLAPEPNKSILWPPNHQMVNITIQANADDNSGVSPALSATVASNEPQEGLDDGDTAPDWTEPAIDQFNGIISLQLRAERSGSGDGRVYTIAITATDNSGNSSTAPVEIIVPHDKGKK